MRHGWTGLALALCLSSAGAAEVYRWQDERGQWHFSDPQAAGSRAQPLSSGPPISIVPMHKPPAPGRVVDLAPEEPLAGKGRKAAKGTRRSAKTREQGDLSTVEDRQVHARYCERQREKLRKSKLGLRDHEAQDAYDRECILKVHW